MKYVSTLMVLSLGLAPLTVQAAPSFGQEESRVIGEVSAWLAGAPTLAGVKLQAEQVRVSPLGTHVIFRQYQGNLPVFDGYVGVSLDPRGEVFHSWSTLQPARSGQVRIDATSALREARRVARVLELEGSSPRVELGVGASGPAYRIELTAEEPLGVWRIQVDATTGRSFGEIQDVARYVDGSGQGFKVSASVALQSNALKDNKDAASAVPASAYSTLTLMGLDGSSYLVGPYADLKTRVPRRKQASSSSNSFVYDREDDRFESVQAYWSLDYAQRWIQSLGFDDVNNRQLQVAVGTSPADNSFYSSGSITFGSGGVDDAEDSEIVWHEMGHAIQDDQVPGFGVTSEGGSMGEGFGDYIGASIGSLFSGGWQDACVGEWDAISYSNTNPPCLRRVDGDKVYPDDLQGEVHADGEIWSAALWDCRAIVGNDTGVIYTLSSHFLLSPTASFEDGANAYLTAAERLGASRQVLDQLEAAFVARGIL